jgi:putative Mg2+ transporter-C (MgtC) family protein
MDFDLFPHVLALAAAYVLALPIGWNREKEERSAGIRTCGLVQATEGMTRGEPEAMARIIEGLITGMGFIGGGAILRLENSVRGTATAASLWVTGAIGVAAGVGSFDVAVMLSATTVLTLWLLTPLKKLTNADPKDE